MQSSRSPLILALFNFQVRRTMRACETVFGLCPSLVMVAVVGGGWHFWTSMLSELRLWQEMLAVVVVGHCDGVLGVVVVGG
ncbi:hypothetical protein RHGRI_029919 [Rhododendron griersonianum]|uniref:Uncharacterized protein n=1 Tax=Rhododendron griersonianum TaxID=479676 RepID=A0AAV6IKY6_9ERIC|nr:hypothetical protein RHGRI_029919 [Rhododendron griersonianum]